MSTQDIWTQESLEAQTRQQLRNLAKEHKIKANIKSVDIIKGILELQEQSGLPESSFELPELSPPEPLEESQPAQHAPSVSEVQLEGPVVGEPSSSPTNIMPQPTTSSPTNGVVQQSIKKTKRRRKQPIGLLQSQEPNQTNNSQESQHQVQQIVLPSDNSGSSLNLSNSNQTASSNGSLLASIDSRLRKLETSASMDSVQVTDLHKEIESLKTDLEKVNNQFLEFQTRNSELQESNGVIVQQNAQLRVENAEIRKENAELKGQMAVCQDRLAMVEEFLRLKGVAPALDSSSSSTELEAGSAPRLGSPQPICEPKTPKPDTTPKARRLEISSTSEHTAVRDSTSLLLPALSLTSDGPVEIRATQLGNQVPSGSRHSAAPGSSHPPENTRKRDRDTVEGPALAGPGSLAASGASAPSPKRVKLNTTTEEEEDPTLSRRIGQSGEPARGGFTTPPNPRPRPTPVRPSRPDFPFNRGSPSPQQRQLPRMPATGNTNSLRHRVHSPARRPGTNLSSTQPIIPVVGDVIPGAPGQVMAVPVRGDDTGPTAEATFSRPVSNHRVASSTLAGAVAGVFNPPSSSTPAHPGSNTLLQRTPATTSRPARGSRPYEPRFPIGPPALLPPAISAEGRDSGGSQSSNGSNSSGAEGANQAPPTETVIEPATPNSAGGRMGLGMPVIPEAQPFKSIDVLRFPGALQLVRRQASSTPTPVTPDGNVRQAAPETPMASSTRYGTEINSSP